MRALFRTTACIAAVTAVALLIASSAFAVTIVSAGILSSGTGDTATQANVATANAPPYCSGSILVITGSGFVYDSANPGPSGNTPGVDTGAVTGVSIGGVPAAWYAVGSDITLYAQVGKGATTGPIVVTTPAGSFSSASLPGGKINPTATSAQSQLPGVQVIPCVSEPTIVKATVTGVKPNPVKAGKTTSILGAGFSGVTAVTIGGKATTFAVVQDQNMVITVPAGAKVGKNTVVLTNSAGSTTTSVTVKAAGK